jgi:hypothetical protein
LPYTFRPGAERSDRSTAEAAVEVLAEAGTGRAFKINQPRVGRFGPTLGNRHKIPYAESVEYPRKCMTASKEVGQVDTKTGCVR